MDLVGNTLAILDGGQQGKKEDDNGNFHMTFSKLTIRGAARAAQCPPVRAFVDQGHARLRSKMMFIAPFTFAMHESLPPCCQNDEAAEAAGEAEGSEMNKLLLH